MLKITEGWTEDGTAVLYLEGQVVGPWLAEIRRCCELVLATNRRLVLDLTNVSFVEREAITLLREMSGRDVAFTNCSPFVAEQLKEVGPCSHIETADHTQQ